MGPAARLVLPPHPLRRDSTTAATGSPAQSPQRAHIPRLYYFQNLPKHLSWPCPRSRRPEAGRQEGSCVGGAACPRGRARDSPCRGGETGQHRWGGVLLGGVEGQHLGLVGDAQEARGRPRGGEGSLEAVEDLALQAMLDLAAPQHELQDFVDGVLRVFLLGEVLDDAVLGHLGADGKAALKLLLDSAQHLLVLLAGEALHPCGQREERVRTGCQGSRSARGRTDAWRDKAPEPRKMAQKKTSTKRRNTLKKGAACGGLRRPEQTARKSPEARARGTPVQRAEGTAGAEHGGRNPTSFETHPGAGDMARLGTRGQLRSLGHSMGLGLILGEQPVEGSAER